MPFQSDVAKYRTQPRVNGIKRDWKVNPGRRQGDYEHLRAARGYKYSMQQSAASHVVTGVGWTGVDQGEVSIIVIP